MSICGHMVIWKDQPGVPDGTMTICGEQEGHLPPHRDGEREWEDQFPSFEDFCKDNDVDDDLKDVAFDVWFRATTGWDA